MGAVRAPTISEEPIMQAVTTIGLDIAKSVFQVHGIDAEGLINPCHENSDPILGEGRQAFMDPSSVTSKRSGSPLKVRYAAVI